MKRALFVLFVALVVGLSVVAIADSPEKVADTKDYTMSEAARSDSTAGNIDGSDTFDRMYGVVYDGTCAAVAFDSSSNGVGYEVFPFYSPTTENLDASTTLGTLTDTLMFVYCDPFDPTNPDLNLVANDDDDGVGYASAITPADGVSIAANTTYYMVISGFSPTNLGAYTLDLGGDAVFGVFQAPTPTPVPVSGAQPIPTIGRKGVILMALLLGGVALLILRRRVV